LHFSRKLPDRAAATPAIMIISRTPFRISFFGGGTDYPDWYRRHGGAVLATTINKYLRCICLTPRVRSLHSRG